MDSATKTIRTPVSAGPRYFRLRAQTQLHFSGIAIEGNTAVLRYD